MGIAVSFIWDTQRVANAVQKVAIGVVEAKMLIWGRASNKKMKESHTLLDS